MIKNKILAIHLKSCFGYNPAGRRLFLHHCPENQKTSEAPQLQLLNGSTMMFDTDFLMHIWETWDAP